MSLFLHEIAVYLHKLLLDLRKFPRKINEFNNARDCDYLLLTLIENYLKFP